LQSRKYRRRKGGAQILEFGGAVFIFLTCIVIPLIDLSFVPLRFGLGKSVVSSRVKQLAQVETLTEALQGEKKDNSLKGILGGLDGIAVKSSKLSLIIKSNKSEPPEISIDRPGTIPKKWLPDGSASPCEYSLDLIVNVEIFPLIVVPVPFVKVPGLTEPIPLRFNEVSVWENLGRDPVTGEFCVNQ
jgi:hypothetical protein